MSILQIKLAPILLVLAVVLLIGGVGLSIALRLMNDSNGTVRSSIGLLSVLVSIILGLFAVVSLIIDSTVGDLIVALLSVLIFIGGLVVLAFVFAGIIWLVSFMFDKLCDFVSWLEHDV